MRKVHFRDGSAALVLNYETDVPIDDMKSLRKEVDTIWRDFQKDVENAGLTCGVIRATHYEGTGIVRRGRGYGFVFTRGADGEWRPDDDSKTRASAGRARAASSHGDEGRPK